MAAVDLSKLLRPGAAAATFSKGMARSPHVAKLLESRPLLFAPRDEQATGIDYVVGWGRKHNTARAQLYAAKHSLPYLRLEDGFVRSVGLGVNASPAYSIVIDDLGIYYDGTRESRLEAILESGEPGLDEALIERAQRCIRYCVDHQLSKYNDSPVAPPSLPPHRGEKRILLVDQTAGDLSLRYSGLSDRALVAMVEAARQEHPVSQLLIKSHPDVQAGKRKSALVEAGASLGAHVLSAPCNPIALLQQIDHVYVGSSQLGFEALMCGKPVTCFGMPFYSGWGLTDDRKSFPRRTRTRSLPEVFAAAYLLYGRYLDPQTGARGELEQVLEHMSRQREMFRRNAEHFLCFGFANWKQGFVRAYLRSPSGAVAFNSLSNRAGAGRRAATTPVVWGVKNTRSLHKAIRRNAKQPMRMEDGFLRSAGLGSDLTVPASLVLDAQGIYYDPHRPSDLETILQEAQFCAEELARAERLRMRILSAGISKYNLGGRDLVAPFKRPGQRVVLVPGQVETDASIKLGCRDIRDNLSLLKAVRASQPSAYIIYKPHPDVVSRNRKGGLHQDAAAAFCDQIVVDTHISVCLSAADEVHTMTSLVGFEGLMRELPVTVYGLPFYAGWGLTRDRHRCERRTRALTLDMLVAGTLLRYPRYVHPETLEFITAEGVVAYLESATRGRPKLREPLIVRQARRLARSLGGVAGVR